MSIPSIAVIIIAIVAAFFIFRFLGGCLIRLIIIALVIGVALYIAHLLGWP